MLQSERIKMLPALVFGMQYVGRILGVARQAFIDDFETFLWYGILFSGQDDVDDGSIWKTFFEDTGPLTSKGLLVQIDFT